MISRDNLLKAREQSTLTWKIMQKVSMDEKGTYRRWKQGRAAWEEQRHNLNTMDRIKNLERL